MTDEARTVQMVPKEALSLALMRLFPDEPGDSRAVSGEFVALATVECRLDTPADWAVIRAALAAYRGDGA